MSVFPPRPAGQMLRRDYSAKFQDPTPRMGQGALGQGIRDKHRYTYLRILGTLYNTYLSSYVSAVPITKRCIDTYRVLICQSAPPFPPLQPSHPRHLSTSPRHPTSILLTRANHYIYTPPPSFLTPLTEILRHIDVPPVSKLQPHHVESHTPRRPLLNVCFS